MRKLLQKLLRKPVLALTRRFSSNPDKQRIFKALSDLLNCILEGQKKKGLVVPFDITTGKMIIFSDQHKGARNGADDFTVCEPAYLGALEYYYQNGFHLIGLGDCEELWENSMLAVRREQQPSFAHEKKFIPNNAFIKIFGNHDLYWQNDPFAPLVLKEIYGSDLPIYEGVVLQTIIEGKTLNIFCTHGHQGDAVSDGNWFSKFFVSKIWAPLQSYLKINPNTPAYDANLKTVHNTLMYEWSAQQQNLVLITGHTHQPVFESLTHIERLYRQLLFARKVGDQGMINSLQDEIQRRKFEYASIGDEYLSLLPGYFNSGCCCYDDGVITGIEIAEGCLRLIKWSNVDGKPQRILLEESSLQELMVEINRTGKTA
ncbi:MAG TPA: metallophosphoesterase [Chitinophagaceae bacterium]|jgi:predicted phosphodiesterase|nr:metallophosphoesterase [Chitinophagaceae bacterium]